MTRKQKRQRRARLRHSSSAFERIMAALRIYKDCASAVAQIDIERRRPGGYLLITCHANGDVEWQTRTRMPKP